MARVYAYNMIAETENVIGEEVQDLDAARRMIQQLRRENHFLSEELRLLKHRIFGRSSERGLDNHPELFAIEPAPVPEPEPIEVKPHVRQRQHPGRHEFPEHLPKEIVEVPLGDADRTCSICGANKDRIGVEITRELELIPAKLFIREYHREKCACRKCLGEVTTAPAPSRPIEKGLAGPGLLAQTVVDKYADHLPLYRQEKRWAREGVRLSRETLCGWIKQTYPSMARIVDAMKKDLWAEGYIQADEVPVPVRNAENAGRNTTGYLWEYSRPHGPVIFDFQMGRARAGPMEFLKGYKGHLQHDAYDAYTNLPGAIIHVACMAHIRRKFWEARKVGDLRADKVIRAIKRLYRIEKEAREAQMSPEQRLELRQRKSVRRMALLRQRIERLGLSVLPRSALGKACAYALRQWPWMENYLHDGRVEIDNNYCENGIRPITLGRKNWLHIGSENAGPWTATYASLVETCRRWKINPFEYFRDVFSRIADHPVNRIDELTPMRWKAACDAASPS